MDVEILRRTSQQIPNYDPTKTGHNPSNTSPPTDNDTQDSDADSLGSIGIMMAHRHTTMNFAVLSEASRKEPATFLQRRSYQREPKREAKLPFLFVARSPAATSSVRQ